MSVDPVLVSALVVGSRKTGTTWLNENFKLSSIVIVPTGIKETGFFVSDSILEKSEYHSLFNINGVDKSIFVEVDTSLLDSAGSPAKIKAYNSKMKIVVIRRDAHEFASSRFIQGKRKGLFTHGTLLEELNTNKSFRNELRFSAHVQRYRDHFPSNQILVVDYKNLQGDPSRFYDDVFSFITGQAADHCLNTVVINKAREARFSHIFLLGVSLGKWLRKHRLYFIANFLKSIANTSFFQKSSTGIALSSKENALIQSISDSALEE
jgi:hypothetical protein